MAVVDGRSSDYLEFVEANSVISGEINGVGDLLLTKGGGAQQNAGYVRGNQGPDGPAGDVIQADVDAWVDKIIPGSWANLPLAANWVAQGSPWATPRYRRNDYTVELDGLVKYTGTDLTVGDSAALTTALPAAYRPAYKHAIGAWPYLGNSGTPDVRIFEDGIITVYVFYSTIATNHWISLTGKSYPLS